MAELTEVIYGAEDNELHLSGNTHADPGGGDNHVYIGGANNTVTASGDTSIYVNANNHNGFDKQVEINDFSDGDTVKIKDPELDMGIDSQLIADAAQALTNAGIKLTGSCSMEAITDLNHGITTVQCKSEEAGLGV